MLRLRVDILLTADWGRGPIVHCIMHLFIVYDEFRFAGLTL